MEQRERIGVIGLGRMGRAIAARLAAAGYAVRGWNRSAGDAVEGVAIAPTLAGLAAGADILILSLYDDAAVREVLDRLLAEAADLSGRLIVDTSTVAPEVLREAAPAFHLRGAGVMDAPIAGGPDMIRAGQAGFYLGGTEAEAARVAPVLDHLAARRLHVGPLGAGATAKILNNMMLVTYWQCLKETLSLGRAAGLDPRDVLRLLGGSPAASGALVNRLPVLLGESDAVGFTLSGALKDGRLARHLAAEFGLETPALSAGVRSFAEADDKGLGDRDLVEMVRDAAGLH